MIRRNIFTILVAIMTLIAVAGFLYPFVKDFFSNSIEVPKDVVSDNSLDISSVPITAGVEKNNKKEIALVAPKTKNSNQAPDQFVATSTNIATSTSEEKLQVEIATTTDVVATSTDVEVKKVNPNNAVYCFVSSFDYHKQHSDSVALGKNFSEASSSQCLSSYGISGHMASINFNPSNQFVYYAYPENLGPLNIENIQVSINGGVTYHADNSWILDKINLTNSSSNMVERYYLYSYLWDGALESQSGSFIIKFP